MKHDKQLWQQALLLARHLPEKIGDRRKYFAEQLNITEAEARSILSCIENKELISGIPDIIPTKEQDTELIIADMHIPFMDNIAMETIINESVKNHNITIVSLLGDVLDMYKSSFFKKNPTKGVSIIDELKLARQFIELIRSSFPQAKIIYLQGNHEQRFMDCVDTKNPDYHDVVDGLLQTKLGLDELDVEYKSDVYKIGNLWHLHGHERKGGWGVINVCKVLMERVFDNFITAHFHQTQEMIFKRIDRSIIGGWSIGHTATEEAFDYNPLNKWNQGFAIVKYDERGDFNMSNHKIYDGRVL